ncbi:transposase [Jeotgalibacillus soli]|uniref:Transposase n=1 Tax=Jeotgalibacillus soli TaxID=889306 RepID=A0A0C2S6L5_9BACL|nr:transposase [Jeotgalibacillus soli]KIL49674.1 hypothetical protein KP78_11420 [Jeotgalibacillus soli]
MTKYSIETKLAAIYTYLDGVESFKDTAQKYNSVKRLGSWVPRKWNHSKHVP